MPPEESTNPYIEQARLEEQNTTGNGSIDENESSQGFETQQEQPEQSGNEFESSTESSTNSNQSTEAPKVNPNWNEALQQIPEDYHGVLTPVFDKWDKHNNSRLEKVQQQYAPYQPLVDNEVPMEEVQKSYALRQAILNNPQEVFQKMAEQLGYDLNALQNGGDPEESNSQGFEVQEENQEMPDISKDPRFQELANQTQVLAEREQERIQQQNEERMYKETVTELDRLQDTYGQFDRNRAVQFALWEQERTGQALSIENGVKAMLEYNDSVRQNSANNKAPEVFSGNGSLPSGRVDTRKMSDDEADKYANMILKRNAQSK